jgi:hypothetical protein
MNNAGMEHPWEEHCPWVVVAKKAMCAGSDGESQMERVHD